MQVHKGHAYVGAVGGSSFNGPEGFTVHDVRDPRKPKKVGEFRAPPGVHCHKLRIVGDNLLYVNSERLAGDQGKNARAGFFIFDVSTPSAPKPIVAPGTPFPSGFTDLQSWTRDDSDDAIEPDWLRVGTDITHQGPFNATFSVSGSVVPEPSTWALMVLGFAGLCFAGYRRGRSVISIA